MLTMKDSWRSAGLALLGGFSFGWQQVSFVKTHAPRSRACSKVTPSTHGQSRLWLCRPASAMLSENIPRSDNGRAPNPTMSCNKEPVLIALRKAVLPLNKRRVAGRMAGMECRGCTLGITEDYGTGRVVMTAATRKRPQLARALCDACRTADPNFRFTSIQVNLNTRYSMHTDGYDAGPSRMYCCGNFTRGRMWLHSWKAGAWQAIDVHNRWIGFDGREFHMTESWDGPERFSLVYFTHPGWRSNKLASDAQAQLEDLGFAWPARADEFGTDLPGPRERSAAAESTLPVKAF